VSDLTFPDNGYSISGSSQVGNSLPITRTVSHELCAPKFFVCFGHRGTLAARVVVPKTSMHKDCPLFHPIGEVRGPRKLPHVDPIRGSERA
jgi:hypothetical protein